VAARCSFRVMDEAYPRSLQAIERRFTTEAPCLAYVAAVQWPAFPQTTVGSGNGGASDLARLVTVAP